MGAGPDEKWHAIPGSGNARECSSCGRTHEIHARVELANGTHAVIGTGCAARDAMDLAPILRSGEARAKRLAELDARRARAQALVNELRHAAAEVDRLPVPPLRTSLDASGRIPRHVYAVGDGVCSAIASQTEDAWHHDERAQCAAQAWRRARLRERGITQAHEFAANVLEDLEHKRARLVAAERNAT